MNTYSLEAVLAFALAFLAVYALVYREASKSYKRGEIGAWGIRILRLGLYGHLAIFAILTLTAFIV